MLLNEQIEESNSYILIYNVIFLYAYILLYFPEQGVLIFRIGDYSQNKKPCFCIYPLFQKLVNIYHQVSVTVLN